MKDMTRGNPTRLILQFAIPLLIGQLFQLVYSLTDTRIVGSFLGEQALAAVGATNSLNSLMIGFLMGLTNGFAIVTARYFGAQDQKGMKKAIAGTVLLSAGTVIVLTVVMVAFLKPLLLLLNTPDMLLAQAASYFRIILLGMLITVFYNACAATLRAVGDSITPLIFLVISTVLNVGLDLLLICGFHMGVASAAVATVFAQAISVVLCLLFIRFRYPQLVPGRDDFMRFRHDHHVIQWMYSTGLSMGFMLSLVNIGSVVLQSAINTFGANIIVSHTAARKLTELFMMPFSVLASTMATYCSQNLGAGQFSRIRTGIWRALLLSWCWCGIVIVITNTIVPTLVYLVTGTHTEEIIQTASLYLRINSVLYFVTVVISVLRNSLQGMGDMVTPLISSTIELVGKVLIVMLLVPRLDYMGVIVSEPIIWCIMVLPLIAQVLFGKRFREIRKEHQAA
ncbi:MAG: MATE family efflux transporter [Clostridiales bacterium]|nr:MATE family efflux transporter [Clostridiales bacterium]